MRRGGREDKSKLPETVGLLVCSCPYQSCRMLLPWHIAIVAIALKEGGNCERKKEVNGFTKV